MQKAKSSKTKLQHTAQIIIIDSTLRDGNHAVGQQINKDQIEAYAEAANNAGIPYVVVGHGNGLGASSLQVGESLLDDREMIKAARKKLVKSKLGAFMIPGFATVNKDLAGALDLGVDFVCVATHCTEVDIAEKYVHYVRSRNLEVFGILMLTHMMSGELLIEQCQQLESYGANGVILMDSAGSYIPKEVINRISNIVAKLKIPVGFHAHNNLGLAVANTLAAVEAGARIVDGCSKGFGAGAGNAQIEVIVAVLEKMGFKTGIDLYKMLDCADIVGYKMMKTVPYPSAINIISGLAGVFSGFAKHVERISSQYKVDPRDVFFELGKKKVVAGQEDMIMEVATFLAKRRKVKKDK